MVGWGCRMRAFNLKAPLGLSCSCTLPETHQLLEVKYPLCLFPQHTCSWLCAPMSPSPVCSCCPNISQHPSAGVTGPGTMKCSSSLLLCSPSFASWLSWLHSSCPPFRLPTWLSFASGWWWWGGGWWDMRGDRTAKWSLAFLSGQNSHCYDYSPFPRLLVPCRRYRVSRKALSISKLDKEIIH